jgi:hypothetical protein
MSAQSALHLPGRLALLPLLLGLLGCGGGGGSGSHTDFTLSFTPGQLTARFFHNQRYGDNTFDPPVTASVNGTITPIPSGNLYVVIALDFPVFTGTPTLTPLGGNAFSVALTPDGTLAAGTHSGTLKIDMYGDAALTKHYSVAGNMLPYTLTVDPELTVTAKIDGVAATTAFSSSNTAVTAINGSTIYWNRGQPAAAFTLSPGKVLELQANIPVTWHSPDQFYPYGSLWSAPTVTSTTLTQTMAAPPDGTPGMTGNAYIAVPATGSQFGAGLIVDIQR